VPGPRRRAGDPVLQQLRLQDLRLLRAGAGTAAVLVQRAPGRLRRLPRPGHHPGSGSGLSDAGPLEVDPAGRHPLLQEHRRQRQHRVADLRDPVQGLQDLPEQASGQDERQGDADHTVRQRQADLLFSDLLGRQHLQAHRLHRGRQVADRAALRGDAERDVQGVVPELHDGVPVPQVRRPPSE